MLRITSKFAGQTARRDKIAAGLAISIVSILATALPAAAQLVFSSDCRNYQPIAVAPPNDAILFTKQPVPHPNGTASVFAIVGADTYVIPAGANSCIVAAPPPMTITASLPVTTTRSTASVLPPFEIRGA